MVRKGDTVKIAGDYQYKALVEGNTVQRMWHLSKQLAIEALMPPQKGDKVVDVGCGSGVISSFLGTLGAEVLGVDGNLDAIQFATKHYANDHVNFLLGLVDESFGESGSFDKIYCLEVIEHLPLDQGRNMLSVFHNLLVPGGKVFLTTPNYRSAWIVIEWLMDKLHLAPPLKEHQHVERYHKKKLAKLAEESGFQVVKVRSNCFFSPWMAPWSWNFAKRLACSELNWPVCWGSVLVAVLSKREHEHE